MTPMHGQQVRISRPEPKPSPGAPAPQPSAWAPSLYCCICHVTDPEGAPPAVMVVNGLSVCSICVHFVEGGAFTAAIRLAQQNRASLRDREA